MFRDWDDAFCDLVRAPEAAALQAAWVSAAAAYRSSLGAAYEAAVGLDAGGGGARFDLVHPAGAPRGLLVFVHGGCWMRADQTFWTHLAAGARAHGWAVALPGCPSTRTARIGQIASEIGASINAAAARVEGPVRLAGHSAGGHLVARMLCADTPLTASVQHRLERAVAISGLYDLRPLLNTAMKGALDLDLAQARAESPVLTEPFGVRDLTIWVGGAERPEFIRQARLMALMWDGFDGRVRLRIETDHTHVSVIEALAEPHSDLTRAVAE